MKDTDGGIRRELFIPDVLEDSPRVRREQQRAVGSQMVVSNISGEFFRPTTFSVDEGSVVAIIGDNVRARDEIAMILADKINPKTGSIQRPSNSRVEYIEPSLPENVDPTLTIKDYFYEGRGLLGLEEQLNDLYIRMATDPSAVNEAGKLQERLEFLGGWNAINEVTEILNGLNVAANVHDEVTPDTPISELSSGQTSKVIVGRALFSKAGIIVMNEPAVHLDVLSKQWLESYLQTSRQAVVVTTSDMSFTENVANRVIEITETGLVIQTATGLTTFIQEREKIINHWVEVAEQKLEEVENWRQHVRDLQPMAKRSADMAQVYRAAQSKLERMEKELEGMPGLEIINSRRREVKRKFEAENTGGVKVIEIPHLEVAYEDKSGEGTQVIDVSNLVIQKGDRVAIVGRNGSGKSTLLKVLTGNRDDMIIEGEVRLGPSINYGYYSPYTELPQERTTLRELIKQQSRTVDVGSIMDFWGFGRSEYYSTAIQDLRHKDEQARAQLAVIMAKKSNLIILDEPTSYLTPVYRAKLTEALEDYDGTLLVVSHDPDFLIGLGINALLNMPEAEYRILH